MIVIKRSSWRIFSFGKRNGRWANLHCGITCRKLTANNFCQFIFIYGWIKPMVVVSFLHISLRMSLDDVCLVMVMMMRMMIIKATLTHVSITIAITIVIKQCVLDFCLIIEYCLGYIAIWAHVFVRACVCMFDIHVFPIYMYKKAPSVVMYCVSINIVQNPFVHSAYVKCELLMHTHKWLSVRFQHLHHHT